MPFERTYELEVERAGVVGHVGLTSRSLPITLLILCRFEPLSA